MKFTQRAPCDNCPFRKDVRFYLTRGRAKEIAHCLLEEQGTFPCHKTLDYGKQGRHGGDGAETKRTQHCAGAMIMLEKLNRPNQMMRIAERCGFYDHTKLKMDSPVYKDFAEFIRETSRR